MTRDYMCSRKRCTWMWILLPSLTLGYMPASARGEDPPRCPPCQQPNPDYDPNDPYESEPKCINQPLDDFDSKQKEASCPAPVLDGVAKMGGEFGFTDPGDLEINVTCKEGCDGKGSKKYKMTGDVKAEIVIKVYTENEVKGRSFSQCGWHGLFATRKRSEEMLARTTAHEQVHCKAFINALTALKKAIKESPLRTTPEDCAADVELFKQTAAALWDCIRIREHNHCSHAGENAYTIDICGIESEGGPRTIGPCPDCN